MIRSRSYFTRSATFNAVFNYTFGRGKRPHQGPFNETTQNVLGYWSLSRSLNPLYKDGTALIRRGSDNETTIVKVNQETGIADPEQVRAWNGWNLLARTEELNNSTWQNNMYSNWINATVRPDEELSPVGTQTADVVVFTSNLSNRLQRVTGIQPSTTYTFSIWAKPTLANNYGNGIRIKIATGSNNTLVSTNLNFLRIDTGLVSGQWTRFSVTATTPASGVNELVVGVQGAESGSAPNAEVAFWGAQLERASSFSTYEPRTTTGAGDSFLVTLYEQAENGRNLLARTEEVDVSPWTNSISGTGVAPTVTANAGTSPLGDSTADRIQFSLGGGTTSGDIARRVQFLTPAAGVYTYSIYIKSFDSISSYNMHIIGPTGATTNVVVTGSWQRFTITDTAPGTSVSFGLGLRGAQTPANSNTVDVLVWGAQLEVGTTATTYERRTTHGAGTRLDFTQSTTTLQPIVCEQGVVVTENNRLAAKLVAADARRMSIASSTAMFNALHTTGGTVLAVSRANDTAAVKVILRNKSSSNLAGFQLARQAGENAFMSTGRLDVAGVATIGNTIDVGFAGTISTAQSVIAAVYDPDNATAGQRAFLWHNGAASPTANAATGTPFVENTASDLSLGSTPGGSSPFDGTISEVALFSSLLSTADRLKYEANASRHYGITITESLVSISAHPSSVTTTGDVPYTLSITAENATHYQWQYSTDSGVTWLPGDSNTNSITVTATLEMNGWQWRCVAMNPFGGVISNTATVTVQGIMAKVDTFNSPTVHGSQAVTGIGFQPKVILPFTAYQTSSAQASNASISFGCADSDAQAAIGCLSQTALTTSSTGRSHDNSKAINHYATPAFSQVLEASRTSFDSDGFTLNWTDVDAVSRIINIVSLGGSTLEANLVQCQMNNTNADQSFAHGLSGTPTAILLFGLVTTSAPPATEVTIYMSIGAWAGGSQFVSAIHAQNGVTTTVTRRYLSSSAIGALLNPTLIRTISISSVDETNINCIYPVTFSSSQSRFYMLCLRGCKAQVGTFDVNGSLDPFSISCPDITPRLFLPIMIPEGVDQLGSIRSGVFYMIGASDGVTNVSCGITDITSVTTTNTRRYQSSTTLAEYDDAGILRSQAVATFSGNSVVYDASTINSVYGQGGYLIIGE